MGQNRKEIGVAYNDGAFTPAVANDPIVIIDGSTTDSCHFMWLTVAEGQRHNGVAGTGVVVDGGNAGGEVQVSDDYTVVDWFEIKRMRSACGSCGAVRVVDTSNVLLSHLIVHDSNLGIKMSGSGNNGFTLRNSISYNTDLPMFATRLSSTQGAGRAKARDVSLLVVLLDIAAPKSPVMSVKSALWNTRFKLQSRLHSTSLRTSFPTSVWGEPRTDRELFDILERADLLPNRLASDSTSLDTEQTVIALLVLTAAG